jgi:hypothetical protein
LNSRSPIQGASGPDLNPKICLHNPELLML